MMMTRERFCLCLVGLMIFACTVGSWGEPDVPFRVESGDLQKNDSGWIANGGAATAVLDAQGVAQSLYFEIQLPAGKKPPVQMVLTEAGGSESLSLTVLPDANGNHVRVTPKVPAGAGGLSPQVLRYGYWPTNKRLLKRLVSDDIEPRSWHGQWLTFRIDTLPWSTRVSMNGLLVHHLAGTDGKGLALKIELPEGAQLRGIKTRELRESRTQMPLDLSTLMNQTVGNPIVDESAAPKGILFDLGATQGDRVLNLSSAGWRGWNKPPVGIVYEPYDKGPSFAGDPALPRLRVPAMDYVSAHVLARASHDPQSSNTLTLRTAPMTQGIPIRDQVWFNDHSATLLRGGTFEHIEVPMNPSRTREIVSGLMDIQPTKEVRLARRKPDPNRFRWRPLGLPSGVQIAAITMELSPLQLKMQSPEVGNAFVEPAKPTFDVSLQNITDQPQPFTLNLVGESLDAERIQATASGTVAPHQTHTARLVLDPQRRGYYDVSLELVGENDRLLVSRSSSLAVLPPDTRKHRDTSPLGTYEFGGVHFTCPDPDITGPLYVKMGMRYGMFTYPPEALEKYGILRGNAYGMHVRAGSTPQAVADKNFAAYEKRLAKFPDLLNTVNMLHEDSISGGHETRTPDLFHDRPAYQMDEQEQERFDHIWHSSIKSLNALKKVYPDLSVSLGNGPLTVKEELLRQNFPAEMFDSLGNESASFGRPPEAQPPDGVAFNASLWMDRQMLDAYGYKDKAVTQCHEVGYPSTNPGNLSEITQADYFVRMAGHSLAWGMPRIRLGAISDVGNGYRESNWGASGFCHAYPALNVKPAFVWMATLTQQLDGANFEREVPLGSPSLYGLQFKRPDGQRVTMLWTIRGKRPVTLHFENSTPATLVDAQANEVDLAAAKHQTVTLSASPCYLITPGPATDALAGEPTYNSKPGPEASHISSLDDLSEWTAETDKDVELEYYNFMTPRRKGDFKFDGLGDFEGRKGVVRVTPQPIDYGKDTMPMYAALRSNDKLPLPGQPTDIGVWVNGNSSWGQVIFEFEDASGQRWISIGAPQDGQPSPWLEDWMPKEMIDSVQTLGTNAWNSNDVFGQSRINFDGWRYVSYPMPGQYPGEGYAWAGNSQWKWDKDGVVHYPLKLTRLIVELPSKTLHLKTFAPAPRPEVYLDDLSVSQQPNLGLKQKAGE